MKPCYSCHLQELTLSCEKCLRFFCETCTSMCCRCNTNNCLTCSTINSCFACGLWFCKTCDPVEQCDQCLKCYCKKCNPCFRKCEHCQTRYCENCQLFSLNGKCMGCHHDSTCARCGFPMEYEKDSSLGLRVCIQCDDELEKEHELMLLRTSTTTS